MVKKNRPKISIYIAASIDGYIARENGDIEWLNCVHGFEEDYGFHSFFDSVDCLILGRKTYEKIINLGSWPYKEKKVIILSTSLQSVNYDAELFHGDLASLLSRLQSENIKHVWIDGGVVISKFLKCGLVDQMIISLIPIILGGGIPLFNPMDKEIPCRLLSSESYPSGLVQLCYQIGTTCREN